MTSEIDRDFTRFLLHHSPLNGKGRHILTKWAESSLENRMFVLNNASLFNFGDIFEDGNDFSIFTAMISQDVTETTDMKMLIQLQQDYMKTMKHEGCNSDGSAPDVENVEGVGTKKSILYLAIQYSFLSVAYWYTFSNIVAKVILVVILLLYFQSIWVF